MVLCATHRLEAAQGGLTALQLLSLPLPAATGLHRVRVAFLPLSGCEPLRGQAA